MSAIKRVVLAYSGGLDTSVILKWLQVTYNCEVVTFTADLGQGEELEPARAKAKLMGIPDKHIYIDDLREEFVRDFVFPMMRANARYEGDYLLGTSIARPLISKRLVENRSVGMKSRGMYETPGGEIYARAHRGIEQITLDRGAAHLKDELMPKYAELIYNGFWFAPEREMLQAAIDHSQQKVSGTVRLKLYKGQASVVGRKSADSLYSERHVTFEDDAGAYDQQDAEGFIKLNALRLRLLAKRDRG